MPKGGKAGSARAAAKNQKAKLNLTVTVIDAAGNAASRNLSVKLRP